MPLEEANKIIENNMKMIDSQTLTLCGPSLSATSPRQPQPKLQAPKTKTGFKSRLGKIMHKLYDLEPESAPEKPLNVDLGVELYQMEDY